MHILFGKKKYFDVLPVSTIFNNCAGVMKDLGINLPPRTVSRRTLRHLLSNPKTICLWRKFYYIGFGKRKLQVTFRKFSQYISIKYPGVPAVQTTQDSILFNFSHLNTHFNFLFSFTEVNVRIETFTFFGCNVILKSLLR